MNFNVEHNVVPPPISRIIVLISATALILGLAFIARDYGFISAQSPALVDYDVDNDGLIEVRTADQWRAVNDDLNGDGIVLSTVTRWHNAFPNALSAAGCPERDHDGMASTAEIHSCIGYELLNDIFPHNGDFVDGTYTATIRGNGFRIRDNDFNARFGASYNYKAGVVHTLAPSGVIEGIGVDNLRIWDNDGAQRGGIAWAVDGTVIGSYVANSVIRGDNIGGIARLLRNTSTSSGLVAHSYVRNISLGDSVSGGHGGLVNQFSRAQPRPANTYVSTCLNSYVNARMDGALPTDKGLMGFNNEGGEAWLINCVGDNTTANIHLFRHHDVPGHRASLAQMVAATGYDTPATNNPFTNWDDYPVDGSTTALSASEPRTDVWHFGDETNLPVHKAWGHDFTLPLDRSKTGSDTVNLCTRTLAVANEIIRHLKDDVRAAGTTTTPADVASLTPCTGPGDTKNVTITNLTNLVVTSPTHIFNLNPDRTFPASERLTSLHWDDFEYLTNVKHVDLSDNRLETLPIRVFQGVPIRYLDVSNNNITSLHPDTFAGVPAVSTVGGNSLLLHGNNLTDTGLPGRVFDSLPHLNGLDLSDNNITRVNTRWFANLTNLGRKAATTPPYTHALGLHLTGNTVTEHHYSGKLFTGVRERIVKYSGSNAADTLRSAIIAASNDSANLSLSGTSYYINSGGTVGYTNTACDSAQTSAPGRGTLQGDTLPACYSQPHWTPPHRSADSAGSAPAFTSGTASGSTITVGFDHTASSTFVGYQLRFQADSTDEFTPWAMLPIANTTGAKTVTFDAPFYSHEYDVELRTLTTTGPHSAAADRVVNSTAAAWLTGFTATTTAPADANSPNVAELGRVTLGWTAIAASAITTNHALLAYYYRYKASSAVSYTPWTRLAAAGATSITLTGLLPSVTYDFQLAGGIDSDDAGSAVDYFTNRTTASAEAYGFRSSVTAAAGTTPGTLAVSWTVGILITQNQCPACRFQIRRKLRDKSWSGIGWTSVPDSNNDGNFINETGYTFTGLLPDTLYDVQVRFNWAGFGGFPPSTPSHVSARTSAVAIPTNLRATTGGPGVVNLTWTQQTAVATAAAHYHIRWRYVDDPWPLAVPSDSSEGWSRISGSSHSTVSASISKIQAGREIEAQIRFKAYEPSGFSKPATVSATSGAVAAPTGLTSTAGRGSVTLNWTQQTATTSANARYELRHKLLSEDWPTTDGEGWYVIPNSTHAMTSFHVAPLTGLVAHSFELRFVWSNAVGRSDALSHVQTPLNIPTPTNFTARAGNDPGEVNLSWTRQTATTSASAFYEFRYRFNGDQWPDGGGWTRMPGSTHATNQYAFYTRHGSNVEVQIRFHWDGYSRTASGSLTTATIADIANFASVAVPASVGLTWDQQTATTSSDAKYQYRVKRTNQVWPTTGALGWTDVPNSNHATKAFAPAGLTVSTAYNVELRFFWNATVGTSAVRSATATTLAIPALSNVSGRTGNNIGGLEISWDKLTYPVMSSDARFQVRSQTAGIITWAGLDFSDVPDGPDDGTARWDESSYEQLDRPPQNNFDAQVRLVVGSQAGAASTVRNITTGYYPRNLQASPGDVPGTIELTWDAHMATQYTGHRWLVQARTAGTSSWPNSVSHPAGDDTSVTLPDTITSPTFTAGGRYDIRMTLSYKNKDDWLIYQNPPRAIPLLTNIQAGIVKTPANFTAAASTSAANAIDISWDAQTESTDSDSKFQYRIKATSTASWTTETWNDIPDSTGASGDDGTHTYDETRYTITEITSGNALTAGQSYDVELRFHWNTTHGESTAASATANAGAVPAPTNFSAFPGIATNSIELAWDIVPGADQYQYRQRTAPSGSWGTWTNVTDQDGDSATNDEDGIVLTGLTAGTQYDYELRGRSGTAFGGAASDRGTAQRLSAPSAIGLAAGSNPGALDISWTVPTSGTQTGFEYRYKLTSANQSGWTTWADVPDSGTDGRANEAAQALTSLYAGESYDVEIRSEAAGPVFSVLRPDNAATQTATAVAAPASFNAAAGTNPAPGTIGLSWTAIPTANLPTGDTVVQYQYSIKLDSATEYGNWVNIPSANTASYTVTGLITYGLYDVRLRAAIDDGGDGDSVADYHSSIASATSVRSGLAAPAGLQASAGANPGEVDLTWTAQTVFDATAAPSAKYQVRAKLATDTWPAAAPNGWEDIASSGVTTAGATVEGLMNAQLHDIEIRFVPTNMLTSAASAVQGTPTAVAAPINFTAATALTQPGAITLSWTPQAAGTGSEATYQVRSKLTSAMWPASEPYGWTDVADSAADTDSDAHNEAGVDVTGLTTGSSYNVEARFKWSNAVGASTAVAATATASPVPQPMAFTATAGYFNVQLNWNLQAASQSTEAKYELRYKKSADSWPSTSAMGWADVPSSTHATDHYTVAGLDGDASYDFELRFHWDNTEGASAEVSATATPRNIPTPTGVMAAPSDTIRQMIVSWDAPTGITDTDAKLQTRLTPKDPATGPGPWTDVPDGDNDGLFYDETTATRMGLQAGRPYDVEVRMVVGTVNGPVAMLSDIRAGYQPRNVKAVQGGAPGEIDVSWDLQTANQGSWALFAVRSKKSSDSAWTNNWTNVGTTGNHSATGLTLTGLDNGVAYDVQATFRGPGNWAPEAWLQAVTNVDAGVVPAPVNLTATAVTTAAGAVTLTWDEQTESTLATSLFEYRYKPASASSFPATGAGSWTTVPDSGGGTTLYDETTITLDGLTPSTSHNFEVRFYWNTTHGNSAASTVTATTSAIIAPASFSATSGTGPGTVDLSWDLITGIEEFRYRFKLKSDASFPSTGTGSWTQVGDSDDSGTDVFDEDDVTVTGLTAGSEYTFEIQARIGTSAGPSSSDDATAQTQAPPQNASFTQGSNPGEISVSWDAPAAGTPTGYGYRFKLSSETNYPTSGTGSWVLTPDVNNDNDRTNDRAFTITGLLPATEYNVQLRTESAIGPSEPGASQTGTVTTRAVAAPGNPSAVAGDAPGEIDLSWVVIPTSGLPTSDTVVNYQFRTRPTLGISITWTPWTNIAGNATTSHTITGLGTGRSYSVELRAAIDDNDDADALADYHSTVASMTGVIAGIALPAGLGATTGSDPGEVDLTWTAQTVFDATSAPNAKYQVRAKLTSANWPSGGGWEDISGSSHSTAAHTIEDLMAGLQHDIEIRFVPTSTLLSGPSSVQGTPGAVPTPTTFTATASFGQVALAWDQQTAEIGSEAKYRLRYKKRSDTWPTSTGLGWADVASSTHSTQAHTVTGLEQGALYDFQLRFHWDDNIGESASASTTATPTAIPAPASFRAGPSATVRQLVLSWNEQTTITDSTAKFQRRLREKLPTGSWGSWIDIPDSDSDGNFYDETGVTISGLTPYRPYDVEVRMVVGSALGAVASRSDVRASHQPRNFAATAGDEPGSVALTWDQQTVYTGSLARFATRTRTSASGGAYGTWTYIGTVGTDHGLTAYTITGLTPGTQYDVQLSFRDATSWMAASWLPTIEDVRAAIVLPPENFSVATATAAASAVALSWDAQTESTNADSKFQYRSRTSPSGAWSGWNDIPDGTDADSNAYNETSFNVTGLTTGTAYDFELRFHWNSTYGNSTSVSAGPATASAIPAPGSFAAASGTAPGSVDLSWNLVEGAQEYRYRFKLKSASSYPATGTGAWTQVGDSGDSGTDVDDEDGITVTGLTAGSDYDFQIEARVGTTSGPSATDDARAQTQSPPQNASFSQGSDPGEIDVSWDAPSTGTPTGYSYRFKVGSEASYPASGTGSWEAVPDVNSNGDRTDDRAFTIEGLRGGISYNIQIRVESSVGASEPGSGTTGTVVAAWVAAPADFAGAVGTTPGTINLTWTAIPSSGLPDNDTLVQYQYRTKLSSAGASTYTSWTNIPAANTASYTVSGLSSYTEYDVQLRGAIDDNDDADALADYYSSTATATSVVSGIDRPANLSATGGTNPGEVSLSWTAQTTFGATFTNAKYEIRYKLTSASWPSGGGWGDVSSSTRTTAAHTLTGLMAAQQYNIELRFEAQSGLTSAATAVLGTPTAVATPSSFSAATSTLAAGSIDLSWTAQTATSGSEAKYQYRRKLTSASWPGSSPFGWTDIADSGTDGAHNESSVRVSGLNSGAAYNIELRFHWSDAVGPSSAATATANASDVPVPGTFMASTGSDPGEINLSWTAVLNATYQVRTKLSSAADSTYSAWSSAITGTTHTVTGLTNASNYTVQVRAVVGGAPSLPATTTAQAQSQPGPQSFAAAGGTNAGEIGLSWAAPSSGTVTRYEYRYKLASVTAYPATGTGSWAQVPDGSDSLTLQSDETSYTITSLLGGLSYNVQLRVLTTAGYSLPATATRAATPVAAPTMFSAARGSAPGEIDLTWTALAASTMPTGDSVVQYQFRTQSTVAGSTYSNWTNIAAANTASYTITGLPPYALHNVQLRAAIDDGGDADSVADYHSSAATQSGIRTGLPNPSNLSVTGGTTPGSVNLTWTGHTIFTAFPSGIFQYRTKLASAAASAFTSWTSVSVIGPSVTSQTIADLMNGQLYDIQLRYQPTSLLFSEAAAVQATPTALAVPTGLSASTAMTNVGAIDVTWTAQSAITVSTAEYQIRAKLRTAAWTGVTWTTVPDDTSSGDPDTDRHDESSHTLTNLNADQLYDVQVRFFMSTAIGGSTPASTSATASSVPVPTGFDATTGSGAGEINLSWTAITGATGYDYRYKLASASTYPAAGTTGDWTSAGTGTTFTITNLSGGVFYDVQLRAKVTGIGDSAATSAERAQAQTTPGPASLTFSQGPNPGDIKIDWTAPANMAPVEHYEYRYKLVTASDSAYSTWAKNTDSDSDNDFTDETTETISGLQAGVSYHVQFRVFASSAIGYSLPQRGTQASRPVPPPTMFRATGGTNPGEVSLSWDASAGVTILRYELRHRLGTDGAWSGWANSGTTTTHSFTGLRAGMARTFEVRAVMQTVGASAAVSTTGTPTPVPEPGSFTASTGTFPGEINMTWLPVTGATSYEYRYKLESIATWPDDTEWDSVSAALTSTTLEDLDEGSRYDIELRAAITNVGESTADSEVAAARSATFTDEPTTPVIAPSYSVSAAEVPGRIAITLPGSAETFIYRHRTANPGEWSRWYKVTPGASDAQFLIPDLVPGVRYEIQVRAYTGMTTGFSTALAAEAQAAPLEAPEDFKARESSGVILLEWSSPMLYTPDSYEYRTRPTGTTTWSAWVTVRHTGDRGSTQRHYIATLETGISHDFELRMQTQAGPSPIASSAGSARLRIAEVHSIRPVVRSVSVRAGDSIALTVDIYDTQQGLDNSIPTKSGSKLRFRWSEQNGGGGTFGTPDNQRRVTYTAPSTPGVYTVQAEAQPDGICTSHHDGAVITDAQRTPCKATFTVRVSALPAVTIPRPDPVNPTGTIPSSLTDDEGTSYAVFTPAEGGTFTGDDVTINAPAAAVPDRTIIGITATVSDIRPDDPIPGATMTVAGDYYDVRAIAEAGDPPLPSFTLNEPATACLPFPTEFRADLSSVVVVQRQPSGELSLLSTKIRSVNGEITICATLSRLPATIGVARLGLVPAAPAPTPSTPADTPDTGAPAPSYTLLLLALLTGALLLTGMRRMRRIPNP